MNRDDAGPELTWNARTLRPVVLLYVLAVFAGFMAVAHLVVHSAEAVKALFLTAIGSVVAMVPGVLGRIEYRVTDAGLVKRSLNPRQPKEFKDVFSWEEMSHFVPTKSGFKFYKRVEDTNALVRFFRLHVLAGHTGEIHVEEEDRARVRAVIGHFGIPLSKPPAARRVGPGPGG